jgi:16S rRNA (guanine1207-N2)-methyltransferase
MTAAGVFRARVAPFAFHGLRLQFELANTVFSSAGVDAGSALLLRHLHDHLRRGGGDAIGRVLDVGCGHGTLGLVLHALDQRRRVTYVDRDALALDYTVRNLERNGFATGGPEAVVTGSLGYDSVPTGEPYDLIVSNIPGKAGEAVIAHLVAGAAGLVRPGGIVALVAVEPIAPLVADLLAGPCFEPVDRRATKVHEVFIVRVTATGEPPASGFEHGLYDRHHSRFRAGGQSWWASTVVGVDEFDTLSYPTRMLGAVLRGTAPGPAVIVNPGQGHRAAVAARSGWRPTTLAGRDLLALRASSRLLVADGQEAPELSHSASAWPGTAPPSRVILHTDSKVHVPWLTSEVERFVAASPGGRRHLVLSGRAGPLGRIEADILRRRGGRVAAKQSERGYRVLRYDTGRD